MLPATFLQKAEEGKLTSGEISQFVRKKIIST